MSFYSLRNTGGEVCPGKVGSANDALCGISERVCIQVKKVYDSCMQQDRLEGVHINVTNIKPSCPVKPLTFVSCKSTSSKGTITDLQIERIVEREHFARVKATVEIPIEVVFLDDNDDEFIGDATITVHKDVIMYVPNDSIVPFEVDNLISAICVSGVYMRGTCFVITVCVTVILKVIAEVCLLIPAYGFCRIPPCEEFAENVCDEFFGLPIFPQQLEDIE